MKVLAYLAAALLVTSVSGPATAQQADPHAGHMPAAERAPQGDGHSGHTPMTPEPPTTADPHAGHMQMSGDPPADPHAHHHHHGGGSPPSSPLEATDAKFDAHLTASTPQNGAALNQSPAMISLTFATQTTIHQIMLTNGAGQRVPVAAALPLEPVGSFMSPLIQLDPGAYRLRWRGSTNAGETGGTVSFSLR